MSDDAAALRALAQAKLDPHISAAVAAAPPLTPAQRDRLSFLLRGASPDPARAVVEDKLRRAVEKSVAAFPPLSEEAKADIARLLSNG